MLCVLGLSVLSLALDGFDLHQVYVKSRSRLLTRFTHSVLIIGFRVAICSKCNR